MIVVKLNTEDLTALPTALLASVKQQIRIDWAYDDAFITDAIGRAIAKLQAVNGVRINATVYEWTPDATEFCNSQARVPYTPSSTFTASDGTNDITANYTVKNGALDGARPQYLAGSWVTGLKVTVTAGYAALGNVPLNMQDKIKRVAAHLYEHREILLPGKDFMLDPIFELDATDWMPAA